MGWRSIDSAPKDGAEFMAWIVRDDGTGGFWEPRCSYSTWGAFQVWGRVDYDMDGWDILRPGLRPMMWQPQPLGPEPDNAR